MEDITSTRDEYGRIRISEEQAADLVNDRADVLVISRPEALRAEFTLPGNVAYVLELETEKQGDVLMNKLGKKQQKIVQGEEKMKIAPEAEKAADDGVLIPNDINARTITGGEEDNKTPQRNAEVDAENKDV